MPPRARSTSLFHEVHAVCGTRIKQQLFCPTCNRVVERSELVKGYEVRKDHFCHRHRRGGPQDRSALFRREYYAVPEKAGAKSYQLLIDTLERSGDAALAKVGTHCREYVVDPAPRKRPDVAHHVLLQRDPRASGVWQAAKVKVKCRETIEGRTCQAKSAGDRSYAGLEAEPGGEEARRAGLEAGSPEARAGVAEVRVLEQAG
jgi:hypothetical protein